MVKGDRLAGSRVSLNYGCAESVVDQLSFLVVRYRWIVLAHKVEFGVRVVMEGRGEEEGEQKKVGGSKMTRDHVLISERQPGTALVAKERLGTYRR